MGEMNLGRMMKRLRAGPSVLPVEDGNGHFFDLNPKNFLSFIQLFWETALIVRVLDNWSEKQ